MSNLFKHLIWKGFVLTILVLILPACASFKGMFGPEEDPKIAALQRETRQVSRSNAATQRSVKDLYNKLDTLQDKLLEIEDRLEDLADREPIVITPGKITLPSNVAEQKDQGRIISEKIEPIEEEKPPKTVPKKRGVVKEKMRPISSTKPTPEVEYDKAYKAYASTRYDEALALFNELLKEHPSHHLADNAQYWIGEIYYDIENFPKAILAFKEVVTKYPKENKAADALLKIGYAYSALDDSGNARTFLKRVIKNYPFSDAEAKARAKLKELENLR